jgi:putative selenium metabolism protein SsnA
MSIVLKNATLFDLDPVTVETADLRIEGDRIVERGPYLKYDADDVIDCGGKVVLPGLVNGHTHLYSALAVGMPPPTIPPKSFLEILQKVWWRLDTALDAEMIELSATVGAIDAVQCGTTTLIDHHASPNCIAGSLDRIENGLSAIGLRGVLCYETTDRHGADGALAGIAENRRFLEKCARRAQGTFAGLVGAHASFTLGDDSLAQVARLADEFNTGVHIHVAEAPCDERHCLETFGEKLIDRLMRHNLLQPHHILAHGIHLDDSAIALLNKCGASLAHNPRSNMNNNVGYAPLSQICGPVLLGTDGIGGDLFAEAQHAWFKSRDVNAGISPNRIISMLAASARRASSLLGLTLGKLRPGAAADVIFTRYQPFTPLTTANAIGHFIYQMGSRHVSDVMIAGRWIVQGGKVAAHAARTAIPRAQTAAERLWRTM